MLVAKSWHLISRPGSVKKCGSRLSVAVFYFYKKRSRCDWQIPLLSVWLKRPAKIYALQLGGHYALQWWYSEDGDNKGNSTAEK